MMLTEDTLPLCPNFEKCKNKGMVLVNGKWWCGKCITDYTKKMEERNEKIMLEELNANNN